VHLHFVKAGVQSGVDNDQTVTTNARGHRSNGPIDYEHKPTGALRIVTIGASTTEEAKLDDHKTWTYLVGQTLEKATGRKVEVINTALSGVRAEQNYEALLESEQYAPDVVTFLLGINDWDHAIAKAQWSSAHRLLFRLRAFSYGNSLLYREARDLW